MKILKYSYLSIGCFYSIIYIFFQSIRHFCIFRKTIQYVFLDVCAHRMILRPQARVEGLDARDILKEILKEVKPPLAD